MAELELWISGAQAASYLPSLVLRECVQHGGCLCLGTMHSQSPESIFHCLRAVKRIHQTQERQCGTGE